MTKMNITSVVSSKVLPFVVVPLIAFIIYQFCIVVYKTVTTDNDISGLQKQVDELEQSQRHLQEFNAFLNSDFFAEKEARIKLGMQKADEKVVVLPRVLRAGSDVSGGESQQRDDGSLDDTSQEPKSNPLLWWEYFFGT